MTDKTMAEENGLITLKLTEIKFIAPENYTLGDAMNTIRNLNQQITFLRDENKFLRQALLTLSGSKNES